MTVSSPQLDGSSYLNKMKDPPATETFSGDKVQYVVWAALHFVGNADGSIASVGVRRVRNGAT